MKNRFDLFNRCRGAFRDAGLLQLHQLREGFFKDIQYGCRLLLKNRSFTVVSVLTLALAIGANTAIFSVVYHLILNPLNIKNGNRAVYVWRSNPKQPGAMVAATAEVVEKWRQEAKSFDAIEPYTSTGIDIVGQGEPESLIAYLIEPTMFNILTELPRLGRPFTSEDVKPGAQQVVIISDSIWKSRFGSDRAVLGRQLKTADKSYTIVGVMSSKFQLDGRHPDLWLPLSPVNDTNASALSLRSNGPAFRSVVAILKKGVSADKAKAELDVLSAQADSPDSQVKGWTTSLITPLDYLGTDVAQALYILFAAVGFVLLIACANVANLMLARNTVRAKEVAIRTALGAARIRLVRQLLTESLLLAAVGGILGVMLGYVGLSIIITYGKTQIPQLEQVSLNWIALGFAFGVSLLTGLLCGFLPSLHSSKVNLNDILKEAGQSASAGIRHNRIRNLLTIAEIALSLVLLVAAGLMTRSFIRLQNVDLGFDTSNTVSLSLALPQSRYGTKPQQTQFFQQAVDRIRHIPQVEAAEVSSGIPPETGMMGGQMEVEGRNSAEKFPNIAATISGPDYFKITKIPLLDGRVFNEKDQIDSDSVAILSEALARQCWPNESAVGKRFRFTGGDKKWTTVVGVVGTIKTSPVRTGKGYYMYFPYYQWVFPFGRIIVRTKTDPMSTLQNIKTQIWAVDTNLPITSIKTVDQMIASTLADRQLNLILLSIFTVIAVVMASVGIYGVMSYSVSQRKQEIGIRVALGAQSSDIMRSILGHGLVLTLIGIVLGLGASVALSKFIANLLFGIRTTDATTLVGVSGLLLIVALLACYIPARRATKLDPLTALRYE